VWFVPFVAQFFGSPVKPVSLSDTLVQTVLFQNFSFWNKLPGYAEKSGGMRLPNQNFAKPADNQANFPGMIPKIKARQALPARFAVKGIPPRLSCPRAVYPGFPVRLFSRLER
jgi:hypothetical protein